MVKDALTTQLGPVNTGTVNSISISVQSPTSSSQFHFGPKQNRCISASPPAPPRALNRDDQLSVCLRPSRRQNSLIIRRQSWQPGFAYCEGHNKTEATSPASIQQPESFRSYRSRDSTDVSSASESIQALSLTPLTKTVSILIGGNCPNDVGWRDNTRATCESPRYVPASPLFRAVAPASYIPSPAKVEPRNAERRERFIVPCYGPYPTVLPTPATNCRYSRIVNAQYAPVSVGPVLVRPAKGGPNHERRSELNPTSYSAFTHLDFQQSLPPLPRSENTPPVVDKAQTCVCISTPNGCEVVVTASLPRGRRSLSASRSSPVASNTGLRPSGSCLNISSRNIEIDTRQNTHIGRTFKELFHHSFGSTTFSVRATDFPSHQTEYSAIKISGDMPNVPSSDGLGAAKANCSPASHGILPTTRASYLNGAIPGDQTPQFCDFSGLSPVVVPSTGKPVPGPWANKLKSTKPGVKVANQAQYFRVQLPCTRAVANPKGFCVTDSLKLYEDQFLNYCDPRQRPQSWCSDFMSSNDEGVQLDDSHSSSSVSTVSSSGSSSSSDAPRSPYCYERPPKSLYSPFALAAQSVASRWPTPLGSPNPQSRPTADEATSTATPANTPTGNEPVQFGLTSQSEVKLSQLPPLPLVHRKAALSNTDTQDVAHLSSPHPPDQNGQANAQLDASLSDHSEINSVSLSSGFDTVRPSPVVSHSSSDVHFEPLMQPSSSSDSCSLTASEAASISTSSLPGDRPNESPPFIADCSSFPPPPVLPPSFRSSDDSEVLKSHSTSPSDSLLLRPPAPWDSDGPHAEATKVSPNVSTDEQVKPNQSMPSDVDSCLVERDTTSACDRQLLDAFLKRSSTGSLDGHIHFWSGGEFIGMSQSGLFAENTSVSPIFKKPFESDSSSDLLSSVTDEGTYAFSTLDSEYLAWMRLNVRDVTGVNKSSLNVHDIKYEAIESAHRSQVHTWVDLFNSNSLGLRLNFVDDSCRLAGTLRVHINLIKPVKMSLRQTMDMLPRPSDQPLNQSGADECDRNLEQSEHILPAPARLVSFFLPRGTSKVVYITSSTTSMNAIQSLLDRFHIQESPRKFALYEHTLEHTTIVARKLSPSERPLLLLLDCARVSSNRDDFLQLLHKKRIVLQENDTCDINWKEFTAAELTNFLRILDKEELEYKNAILCQYGMLRERIIQRLKTLDLEAACRVLPSQKYTRVPTHPHAFQPVLNRHEHSPIRTWENPASSLSDDSKTPAASV